MLIEAMPTVLTWDAPADVFARVLRSYVELLSDSLAALLRRLQTTGAQPAVMLEEQVARASDEAFLRVLTAPETSFRLLWEGDVSDEARAAFLVGALEAEAVREGVVGAPSVETWTALGDLGFRPDGSMVGGWGVDGLMPIDFGSPLVRSVAIGEVDLPESQWEVFSDEEIAVVREKLRAAGAGVEATGRSLLEFVRWFNRVLVCFKDPAIPNASSSGSTGQYVGRSFLTNPHLPGVDDVMVAEALVHEGIHGLLYMQERREAWVTEALYMGSLELISPWSGNPLRLRPYLQACFVWYGLLHFWCLALQAGSFPAPRVRERITQAVIGFLAAHLTDALDPVRHEISAELIEAIDTMQARALRAFTEAAPGALADIGSAAVGES